MIGMAIERFKKLLSYIFNATFFENCYQKVNIFDRINLSWIWTLTLGLESKVSKIHLFTFFKNRVLRKVMLLSQSIVLITNKFS